MEGFVKLFRSTEQHDWYGKPITMAIYQHILIHADYRTGVMITSIKEIASIMGISERQCRTALKHLEDSNDVELKHIHHGVMLTINLLENKETRVFEDGANYKNVIDNNEKYIEMSTRCSLQSQNITAFETHKDKRNVIEMSASKEYIYINNINNKKKKNKNYIEREYPEEIYRQLIDN